MEREEKIYYIKDLEVISTYDADERVPFSERSSGGGERGAKKITAK